MNLISRFINENKIYFGTLTRSRKDFSEPEADKFMFFYARMALWITLPSCLFIIYLCQFLVPGFSFWSSIIVLLVLLPLSCLSIYISYLGERRHLAQGMILFMFAALLTWCLSTWTGSHYVDPLNYYLFFPLLAPMFVGSVIVFSFYPKEVGLTYVLIPSFIVMFSLLVDPNAQTQLPAFIGFVGSLLPLGVFIVSISNIHVIMYDSLAQRNQKQAELSEVHAILNSGLDAAPFGLLCYNQDGNLILERGISAYLKPASYLEKGSLEHFLMYECGTDLNSTNGHSAQAEMSGYPVMVSRKLAGPTTVYSFVDMTERHEWESRIQDAQKLGLIGQITSGITHDYNNSLAVAIGKIEAIPKTGNEALWETHLDLVYSALEQTRQISRKLLALAGERELDFETLQLDEAITAMQPILESAVPDNIHFRVKNDADIAVVTDRGELEVALLNLVINAKNSIGTQTGHLELESRVEDDQAVISVTDDGPGILDRIKKQIFDPFFTTNKARNASGLGLTSVKRFIEDSNGEIAARSQPGQTVFELRFPLDNELLPAVSKDVNKDELQTSSLSVESILIVDDNVQLLEVMAQLVELQDVKCWTAKNAVEAQKVMAECNSIDAVFIDLSMPDMNGIELGSVLMKGHPDSRYYLLTGEALTESMARAKQKGFRGVYFKPLKINELLEAAIS